MNDEFDYLFFPNIEIEYLFNEVSFSQWNKFLNTLMVKYKDRLQYSEYTDNFYVNKEGKQIRHNKYETIQKIKNDSFMYSINNVPIKCNVSKEIKVNECNKDELTLETTRTKFRHTFTFKYYKVEFTQVNSNNTTFYELEIELDINKCRTCMKDKLQMLIQKELENITKTFFL